MSDRKKRMEELKNRAIKCTDCRLHETRTQVVFGDGNPCAEIVLIGEGPGATEDRDGKPFVGRAGQLLTEVLGEAGLSRKELWISNVIKCRACEIGSSGRVKNRPPRSDEVNACRKWIESELKIIEPRVIVCVGNPAANLIIHKGFKMLTERGKWFTDSEYAPFVMAVLHPAYILRQHGDPFDAARRSLLEDLKKAKAQLGESIPKRPSQMTLF